MEKKFLINCGCGSKYHPRWKNIDFVSNSRHVIAHNILKGLPFQNSCADFIYFSHFLEHLSQEQAEKFLINCREILKSNGMIRIVVPDLENIARTYLEKLEKARKDHASSKAAVEYECILLELLDQMVRVKSGGKLKEFIANHFEETILKERFGALRKPCYEEKPQTCRGLISNVKDRHSTFKFKDSGEKHLWMYDNYSLKKLLEKCGFTDVVVFDYQQSRLPEFAKYRLEIDSKGNEYKPNSLYVEARKLNC